ncbi:hypothetical protein [Streptomyces sp. NPDC091299]|uniref:hypothetical protein n=1 Tax=Streptomyces sp. NPDC091299 TaxID=3155302 RepID=UPI0034319AC9
MNHARFMMCASAPPTWMLPHRSDQASSSSLVGEFMSSWLTMLRYQMTFEGGAREPVLRTIAA